MKGKKTASVESEWKSGKRGTDRRITRKNN
jgi:hypothetical protein